MKIKQLQEKTESRATRKTWYADGHEFHDPREAAQYIMLGCPCEYFDEYLDNNYGDVEICGHIFTASESLFHVCRGSYWEDFKHWKIYETENLIEELEDMENGDTGEWFDVPVICEKEEL